MALSNELEEYLASLSNSMSLKKRVLKYIMKSSSPLTQKEIKEGLKQKDWTNIRRVLNELVDKGIILKARIGVKDYYIKIGNRKNSEQLKYQDEHNNQIHLFIDYFEPDTESGKHKIRIKQSRRLDLENYDTLGKITIPLDQIENFIQKILKIKNEVT